MFEVGMLVVCVDDSPFRNAPTIAHTLRRGSIYEIKEIHEGHSEALGLVIHGQIYPETSTMCECLNAARFRPIRPQSIEIFREIANGVRQPEKV